MPDEHLAETTVVVLVTPAEDVPGAWNAHCLTMDLMTQGESVQHAFMMAHEALLQIVVDDLAQGLDPLERPRAPRECWEMVGRTLEHGQPLSTISNPEEIGAAVGYLRVTVPRDALPEHARPPLPEVEMMPPMWQVAALKTLRNSVHC